MASICIKAIIIATFAGTTCCVKPVTGKAPYGVNRTGPTDLKAKLRQTGHSDRCAHRAAFTNTTMYE